MTSFPAVAYQATDAATETSGIEPPTSRGTDYALLSRQMKATGLLERRTGFYIGKIAVMATLFAAGWAAVILIGDSWYQLLVAAFLAVVFTQMGFLGHDAGHGQIFRSARASRVLGVLHGNLGIGLGYGWWISKHTRHHAHPNDAEKDPDVASGVLVFIADGAIGRSGFAAWWTRSQAYLFFPLLLLEGVHLHIASVRDLIRPDRRNRWLELALLTVHLVGYVTVVFLVMSPLLAVAFIVVHQALFGLYMGLSFAPNHKGMPPLSEADSADFLRRQVLTSRNIRGNPIVDLVFGGLNYQIEHHLFPSMPRPNLRLARPIVQAFCADHRVAYRETGIIGSYSEALRHLYDVAAPLRAVPAPSSS